MSSAFTLLGDAVTRRVLRALDGTGLRPAHGYLIQRLLTGPATATEIADHLGISQQAVSKALNELLTLGYVAPATTGDRRRRPMALTPAGHHAIDTARAERARIDARLRAALGPGTFETTMAALHTALDALDLTDRIRHRAAQPPDDTLAG